ncbi:rod shape-determining protein [Candidatus Fermentibacteria bacterium]|nr:MAG: rod shape-determining protein [Candidatus Fermentibacteria bacterium]
MGIKSFIHRVKSGVNNTSSGLFASAMAIDLGTANTMIYESDRGIVLEEPSVIAIERSSNNVIAVGSEAKAMLGRTGRDISVIRPLKDGVIKEATATMAMLRRFFEQAQTKRFTMRPRVLVCVPSGITEVEVNAVRTSLERAGAREVLLVPEPLAAAVGVGLPVEAAIGNMIVDVGGGTTEVAVISMSSIAADSSIRVGGDEMNDAIIDHMKRMAYLLIGERSAEAVKMSLGSLLEDDQRETEISGRDAASGIPKTYTVKAGQIREALREPVDAIRKAVGHGLEKTPPELVRDIVNRGIVLTGGGSLLRGLDRILTRETGLPVRIADNPLSCTVLGAGIILTDLFRYRKLLLD